MLDFSQGIAVFTDGSANSRDRSGGWAWVALDAFEGVMSDSGGFTDTTISRMELMAPAMALRSLNVELGGPCDILVYSDSEYVVLGMNNKARKRNKNVDLWNYLEGAVELHNYVEFQHIKGHAGHEFNELADDLAGAARKEIVGRPA
jgi:ribonuclease HI